MQKHNRIGVLTGGGDCPGLNSVIRAVTKAAINKYGMEVVGFLDGFKGLVENDYMTLDLKAVSGIGYRGAPFWAAATVTIPLPFTPALIANGSQPTNQTELSLTLKVWDWMD